MIFMGLGYLMSWLTPWNVRDFKGKKVYSYLVMADKDSVILSSKSFCDCWRKGRLLGSVSPEGYTEDHHSRQTWE